jgi:hypothetical protein
MARDGLNPERPAMTEMKPGRTHRQQLFERQRGKARIFLERRPLRPVAQGDAAKPEAARSPASTSPEGSRSEIEPGVWPGVCRTVPVSPSVFRSRVLPFIRISADTGGKGRSIAPVMRNRRPKSRVGRKTGFSPMQ